MRAINSSGDSSSWHWPEPVVVAPVPPVNWVSRDRVCWKWWRGSESRLY